MMVIQLGNPAAQAPRKREQPGRRAPAARRSDRCRYQRGGCANPYWPRSGESGSVRGLWLGEVVATAGLLLTIGALTRTGRGQLGPVVVPVWIGAAYFFTSSTSFANPAVSVARSATDSFAGIAPASVPSFVVAQVVGAAVGAALTIAFFPRHGVAEPLDLPEAVHEHQSSG